MTLASGDAVARAGLAARLATARSLDSAFVRRLAPVAFAAAAGATLRLAEPDLVLFKFDEATASRQVVYMLQTHVPVASGTVSSVGGAFPPLFDYLMIPPFLVSPSPVLATAYIAVLNVVALALSAALVWRYAGSRAATLTALLYALSPWAVVASRKIWDPYVLALFAILALWGLLLLAAERRGRGGALFLLSWLWMVQIHPSALLLAPVGFGVLLVRWRALRPVSLAAAAVLGVLPLLPYLAYERGQRWQDVRPFLHAGTQATGFNTDALLYPLQNITGFRAAQLDDVPLAAFLHPAWPAAVLSGIGVAIVLVGVVGAGIGAVRAVRRVNPTPSPPAAVYVIPLLWLVVPTLLALRASAPLFPHYFMTLLPVTFVVIGLGLDALSRALRPLWQRLLVSGITIYALLAAAPLLALFAYLPTPAAAGLQYARYTVAVQQTVDRVLPTGPVAVVGQDEDSAVALVFLLEGRHQVALTGYDWALLSTAPRQVVIGSPGQTIVGQFLAQGGVPAAQFSYASSASHLAVVVAQQPIGGGSVDALRPLHVPLANGVGYVGWSVVQPSPRLLRVTLGWRLAGQPDPAVTDVPYVHLLRGGQMVAQHDGVPYPSNRWQAGQVLYAWFDLPLPASLPSGSYELRTGMYTQPGVRRIPRLGPNGLEDGEFSLGTVTLGADGVQDPTVVSCRARSRIRGGQSGGRLTRPWQRSSMRTLPRDTDACCRTRAPWRRCSQRAMPPGVSTRPADGLDRARTGRAALDSMLS